MAYLVARFGNKPLVRIAAWLGYFAVIVIVCSRDRSTDRAEARTVADSLLF